MTLKKNGPGHSISYKTTCPPSNDWSAYTNAQADESHCFALISQTSKHSLDEWQSFCFECVYAQANLSLPWAHLQSCRKCCVLAEISDILLAGFIFIKFQATPLISSIIFHKNIFCDNLLESLPQGNPMRTHKIRFGAEITNLSSKYSPYLKLYVVLTLTLCMLGNFACFFCRLQIFLKLTFSKKYFRNTIRVSNSLDPDQAQHFAKSGSKLFAKVISRRQKSPLVGKELTQQFHSTMKIWFNGSLKRFRETVVFLISLLLFVLFIDCYKLVGSLLY